MTNTRFDQSELSNFAEKVLVKIGTSPETAKLAVQSLIDTSLMGIDTHGIEALDMYVNHIQRGGLKIQGAGLQLIEGKKELELWDMQNGFGLAEARRLMTHAIQRARESGIFMLTCRNSNHIGACGIYGKIAADEGLIGLISQQTNAVFVPFGGKELRIGASPFAFVAPLKDSFPFYFDASMATISRGQIKKAMRNGTLLPEGVALDRNGKPTVVPAESWEGQLLPIGNHKGIGLAMVFEILSCVLSGNRFASEIPSIVNNPNLPAGSSIFIIVIDPKFVMPAGDFPQAMRQYIEYIESSTAINPDNPPGYPGLLESKNWADRSRNGIPISDNGLEHLNQIAKSLGTEELKKPFESLTK